MRARCTLITGFLGAGKTTLIRHLLAHVPDTHVAPAPLEMAPLPGPPLREDLPKRFVVMPVDTQAVKTYLSANV